MVRIDNADLYNPFGWRLADLADADLASERRGRLLEELLLWEAVELAHGYRHLTIVHGDPDNVDDSRHLSAFYDTLGALAAACGWVRVRGDVEFVTITVAGPDADERIGEFSAAAEAADLGGWTIVECAYPPLI